MLLVNNLFLGAATPPQLAHARFGDWPTLADLVFPWFLLCAGLSLPLSYRSAARRGMDYGAWARKALVRALCLLALGMGLDSAINHQIVLGLGVLQLIGLASLVAALLMPLSPVARGLIAAALLAAYGAALAYVPIPAQGRPVIAEHANLVLYVNQAFLQPLGLRGLPSVVPTAALVVLGGLVGGALAESRRQIGIVAAGFFLAGLGSLWFLGGHPMAKEIWTAPYVLFAGGLGTVTVGALAILLDGRPWAGAAAPLNVFGGNPLLAYAGPILVKVLVLQTLTMSDGKTLQRSWLEGLQTHCGPYAGAWAYTTLYIAIAWSVLALLRARNITLKL